MRKFIGIGVVALSLAFAGSAMASNGAGLYKSKGCIGCHGPNGKGTAMAPAFQGNKYIKDSAKADIIATIKNGRSGSAKHYKKFAIPMPPQKNRVSDSEVGALVDYLKSLSH